MVLTIGVDIGGTKIAVGVVDPSGRLLVVERAATPARSGASAILDTVAELAKRVSASTPEAPAGCGVASAGTLDVAGRVIHATDHVRSWLGTDIVGGLTERLGLPIVAVNDVHAAALGELWRGSASGRDRLAFVAVGTGIGGALVAGGRVLLGDHGFAGSVGHLVATVAKGRRCACGVLDHVEAYASGPGIELSYRESTHDALGSQGFTDAAGSTPQPSADHSTTDLVTIGARARTGDLRAQSVIRSAAQLLGDALVSAITLTDPGVVVLGGGVLGLGQLFAAPLVERVERGLPPGVRGTRVELALLENRAGMVGAGLLAHRLLVGESLATVFA